MFAIKDLMFEVGRAEVWGELEGQDLCWGLSIEATEGKTVNGEYINAPRAYSERLPIERQVYARWSGALSVDLSWDDWHENGNSHANLFAFQHLGIYNSRLRLTPHPETSRIAIHWEAMCDLWLDDDYGDRLDLRISAKGTFLGIRIGSLGECLDQSEAFHRLRNHITCSAFRFKGAASEHEYPLMVPCL